MSNPLPVFGDIFPLHKMVEFVQDSSVFLLLQRVLLYVGCISDISYNSTTQQKAMI